MLKDNPTLGQKTSLIFHILTHTMVKNESFSVLKKIFKCKVYYLCNSILPIQDKAEKLGVLFTKS